MRMFQPVIGSLVDLDDPATYADLPQTIREVLDRLYHEIGYATVYVLSNDFARSEYGQQQIDRVNAFIKKMASHLAVRGVGPQRLIFWQEQLFLFLDEIENMC